MQMNSIPVIIFLKIALLWSIPTNELLFYDFENSKELETSVVISNNAIQNVYFTITYDSSVYKVYPENGRILPRSEMELFISAYKSSSLSSIYIENKNIEFLQCFDRLTVNFKVTPGDCTADLIEWKSHGCTDLSSQYITFQYKQPKYCKFGVELPEPAYIPCGKVLN